MRRDELIVMASDIGGLSGNEAMRPSMKAQLARSAHREVQAVIATRARNTMIRTDRFTYPSGTVNMSLQAPLNLGLIGPILKMRHVGVLTKDEAISRTNVPEWLSSYPRGGGGVEGNTMQVSMYDAETGTWSDSQQQSGASRYTNAWWTIENGRTLSVNPTPSVDLYLVARWVPIMAFDADDSLVLGGAVPYAEDLVVYLTARKYALANGNKEYAMQAEVAYQDVMENLTEFIDVMPAVKGSTGRLGNPNYAD